MNEFGVFEWMVDTTTPRYDHGRISYFDPADWNKISEHETIEESQIVADALNALEGK